MFRSVVLAVVLVSCSRVAPETVVAAPEVVAKAPKPQPTKKLLFRIDSHEGVVTLDEDGLLRIGARELRIELAYNEFFFENQASLREVTIDATTQAILFTEPTSESEDPPNRYRLFLVRDGAIHVAFDRVIGTYGVTQLEFTGKGDVRYREDAWTACLRAPVKVATLEDVTLRLDAHGNLGEVARTPSKETFVCANLAG